MVSFQSELAVESKERHRIRKETYNWISNTMSLFVFLICSRCLLLLSFVRLTCQHSMIGFWICL
jgi:hypothetical protein